MQLPTITIDSNSATSEPMDPPRILATPEPIRPKNWIAVGESTREVPSWLTSLVVHLLCFLLLASVTSRAVSMAGSSPLVLKISMGEELETSSVIEVEVPQSAPDSGETDDLPDGIETSDQPPQRLSPPSEDPIERDVKPQRTAYMAPSMVAPSKYAALTMRLRNRPSKQNYSNSDSTNYASDPIQQQFDQVVDRFIEYDIGKLRGAAGVAANRAFHALGPEAFPALIRGLNRSADIHASCPVGVIAGKVLTTLRNTSDPSLAEYAARHIGDGVSPNAPHYNRILALRDRYIGGAARSIPNRVAKILSDRGISGQGETLELALSLSESPVTTLQAALRSTDEDLSLPATVALLQRSTQLKRADKKAALRSLKMRDMANASGDFKSIVADAISSLQNQLNTELARQKQLRKQNEVIHRNSPPDFRPQQFGHPSFNLQRPY